MGMTEYRLARVKQGGCHYSDGREIARDHTLFVHDPLTKRVEVARASGLERDPPGFGNAGSIVRAFLECCRRLDDGRNEDLRRPHSEFGEEFLVMQRDEMGRDRPVRVFTLEESANRFAASLRGGFVEPVPRGV